MIIMIIMIVIIIMGCGWFIGQDAQDPFDGTEIDQSIQDGNGPRDRCRWADTGYTVHWISNGIIIIIIKEIRDGTTTGTTIGGRELPVSHGL